jgi:hypothetical protein
MKEIIVLFSLSLMLLLSSPSCRCQGGGEGGKLVMPSMSDGIIESTVINSSGIRLDMYFDNRNDIVTIYFRGDTSVLRSCRPASGIWYRNARYELRGKGDAVELWLEGELVFSSWGTAYAYPK